ncbi:hypothetical protein ACKI1I_09005 [Streptomyces turgidiscabies]|uniref:Uncharacterized protein n=1 Tax=Streptomyces turgidiscabies (strain Car8) TaxID=698760 RepID=L7F8C8_STRT8|nr:hypothetical protein [Streptomyces turgidiscabies]ELP67858.1 hypothetical protein STRTUCAR8_02483 [Streptomyces turgidiscabies Car8]MDX3493682.1 hypothetical protein [Streptomyces turgidiscabies]GAQ71724.1 hypothetical protein T45_03468 [Streptomyces turgidiscabies]
MSDSPAGSGRSSLPEPDFLDRLIARHTAGAVSGASRVRPRLPGPFERVEAVRATAPEPDGQGPLWPAAAPVVGVSRPDRPHPVASGARPVPERERTVVHTERVHDGRPTEPAPRTADPEGPLLRPVTPLLPGPRPATGPPRRTAGGRRPEDDSTRSAVPTSSTSALDTASRAAMSGVPRPSAADTTAAREAVRQATARRPGRTPEQVVEVRIGRLEVTAAAPTGGTRRRTTAAERPGATVSLADYLARGRE